MPCPFYDYLKGRVKTERGRGRDKGIFNLLVHWDCAGHEPRVSSGSPTWMARVQSFGPSSEFRVQSAHHYTMEPGPSFTVPGSWLGNTAGRSYWYASGMPVFR